MRRHRGLILGVTGSFGSGKSTVARMLCGAGVKLIDADRIAHRVLKEKEVLRRISDAFGKGVVKGGEVERSKLGALAFRDKKMRLKLQGIVHPLIIRVIKDEIRRSKNKNIILDAPLLIEAGLEGLADKLLVVTISREEQVKRLLRKTNLKKADILRRIHAQYPLSKKVRMADFVIDNDSTLKKTKEQAKKIRRLLWKS